MTAISPISAIKWLIKNKVWAELTKAVDYHLLYDNHYYTSNLGRIIDRRTEPSPSDVHEAILEEVQYS